jgi:hypothetical protein
MSRTHISIAFLAFAAISNAMAEPPKAPRHSMHEMDFLIGRWECRVSQAGHPEAHMTVTFDWLYRGTVLREMLEAPDYSGTFFTTFDRRSDSFKGVAVGSDGNAIIWENGGMVDDRSSETGYVFGAGALTPVSRSTWERLSDTHYVIRDFGADTAAGPGAATDTEDCVKKPS